MRLLVPQARSEIINSKSTFAFAFPSMNLNKKKRLLQDKQLLWDYSTNIEVKIDKEQNRFHYDLWLQKRQKNK